MKVYSEDTKRRLQVIATKISDISDRELELLEEAFVEKLDAEGKTKMDWLRERGMGDQASLLTNVLRGRITSKPVMAKVLEYVLEGG